MDQRVSREPSHILDVVDGEAVQGFTSRVAVGSSPTSKSAHGPGARRRRGFLSAPMVALEMADGPVIDRQQTDPLQFLLSRVVEC
jgi:hypothetical protein